MHARLTRMNPAADTAPALWPSYSELARIVSMSASGFGRYVRSRGVDHLEIGRESRLEPVEAIRLLAGRGLPASVAEREVNRVVEARRARIRVLQVVPKLRDSTAPGSDAELLSGLSQRFDEMVARMQIPEARHRAQDAFSVPPGAVRPKPRRNAAPSRHGG